MEKYSPENYKKYMWVHFKLDGNLNECIDANMYLANTNKKPKDFKHGERFGNATFRLLETELYEEEFNKKALAYLKGMWSADENTDTE